MYAQIIPKSQSALILISIDFCKLSIHYNFRSSFFHRLIETKNTLFPFIIIFTQNLLNDSRIDKFTTYLRSNLFELVRNYRNYHVHRFTDLKNWLLFYA